MITTGCLQTIFMVDIRVENRTDQEVVVVLEPWAAEFSLAAKDYFVVESKQHDVYGKFQVEYGAKNI